jgi:hypothetical protein
MNTRSAFRTIRRTGVLCAFALLCASLAGCQLLVYVVIENASREDVELELVMPRNSAANRTSFMDRYLRGEWTPAHPTEMHTFAVTGEPGRRLDKAAWEVIPSREIRRDATGAIRYTLRPGNMFLVDIQSGFMHDDQAVFDSIAVTRPGKNGRIFAERGMYGAAFSGVEENSFLSLLQNRPAVCRLRVR